MSSIMQQYHACFAGMLLIESSMSFPRFVCLVVDRFFLAPTHKCSNTTHARHEPNQSGDGADGG